MKKLLTKLVMSVLLSLVVFTYSCSVLGEENSENSNGSVERRANYTYNRPPSKKAPGGLEPEQVPQFIIFGWDDNQFADGMNNVLDIYQGLTNPAGVGNPATFDGTPARASFYVTPGGRDAKDHSIEWEVSPETVQTWKDAYAQGHEIGNHTYYHEHGLQFTTDRWRSEIIRGNDFIVNRVGVPRAEITGFRTPFLEYNKNLYIVLKELGFEYDNSFEGGWRYWPAEDGSTLVFPYTMDSGRPAGEDGRDHGVVPGMWQMPTDCIFFPGGRTTGFDYNIWFSKSATKQEFIDMLKYSLHKKYYGNRAPMNFGTHSNYHSQAAIDELDIYDPASVAKLKTTVADRNAAVKEFLEYALTLPGVRIVTTQQALEWQKNPTIMLGANKVTVNAVGGANGSVAPATIQVNEGANVDFTITPDSSYEVAFAEVNGIPVGVNGNQLVMKNVRANSDLNVNFRLIGSCPIEASYSIGSDWGTGFGANLTITNSSDAPISAWEVQLVFSGNQTLGSVWNAEVTQAGNVVTVKSKGSSGNLAPGQSVSLSFNGAYTGENLPPVVIEK